MVHVCHGNSVMVVTEICSNVKGAHSHHLSLQRWEFTGEVPRHVLMMVVVSEVHVVLVYFTLHVTVSVHLNKDLDHI